MSFWLDSAKLTQGRQTDGPIKHGPEPRRRNKVSVRAATKVNNETAPTVNGAVIIAVSAHASGCTSAMTELKIPVTATKAAKVVREPSHPKQPSPSNYNRSSFLQPARSV